MPNGIVTLTTDFGLSDSYVAEMKGALLSINPDLTIIDVSHLVPAQDVNAGAFLIQRAFNRFPAGTLHLAVIDPGVGSDRRGIALEGPPGLLVGPDNGLFALALRGFRASGGSDLTLSSDYRGVTLTNSDYWNPMVSSTFHGRDIFAPVASRLAGGEDLFKFGDPIHSIRGLPSTANLIDGSTIQGRVLWIDHFGNIVLSVHNRDIVGWKDCYVDVSGRTVSGMANDYETALEPRVLVGSSGLLEIAVYRDRAASVLEVQRADKVTVRRLE